MTLPTGQQRVVVAMGKGFKPMTAADVARRVYPNHSAWETMGKAGAKSWQGLVSKVSQMLGNLEHSRHVWQIGDRLWCRLSEENAKHYFEWLQVMCDAMEDNHELREEARDAIYWYLLHLYAKKKHQPLFDQDTVLACVRALLANLDWKGSEQISGSKAVYRGILVLIHQADLNAAMLKELGVSLAVQLHIKRTKSQSRERLVKIYELLERETVYSTLWDKVTREEFDRLCREFDEGAPRLVEEFKRGQEVVGWSSQHQGDDDGT